MKIDSCKNKNYEARTLLCVNTNMTLTLMITLNYIIFQIIIGIDVLVSISCMVSMSMSVLHNEKIDRFKWAVTLIVIYNN
jgi:hypothetical protein